MFLLVCQQSWHKLWCHFGQLQVIFQDGVHCGLVHTNFLCKLMHCLSSILSQLSGDSLDSFRGVRGSQSPTPFLVLGQCPPIGELLVPDAHRGFGNRAVTKHLLQSTPTLDWGVVCLAQKFQIVRCSTRDSLVIKAHMLNRTKQ